MQLPREFCFIHYNHEDLIYHAKSLPNGEVLIEWVYEGKHGKTNYTKEVALRYLLDNTWIMVSDNHSTNEDFDVSEVI